MSTDDRQAYGLLDAKTGTLVATDSLLKEWIGAGSLKDLLPEVDPITALNRLCTQTKLCRSNSRPVLASVEISLLLGGDKAWRLLRVQVIAENEIDGRFRDAVTGLPDRRALEPQRQKWQREASGKRVPHALLFMDLDNFKQVNDTQGHATGDQVLAMLAQRWQKTLRGGDLLVRYGGDEFVVLLAGIRSESESQPVMQRLLAATAQPMEVNGQMLAVSAAIGLALAEDVTVNLEELLAVADRAMYTAKGKAR